MGLKGIHLKLKAFHLRRFLVGKPGNKKRLPAIMRKPTWMIPITHGYHIVQDHSNWEWNESDLDSVVVQREQIQEIELWFFGVFDPQIGDKVTKYIQAHLFDNKLKESQIRKKSKETMRKAYLSAKPNITDAKKADEIQRTGSASAMVINGEKLVMANMGNYRAVFCKDGVAHQIGNKHQKPTKRHWSLRLIPSCESGNEAGTKQTKSSELVVSTEGINAETEFVILASSGIWEVMENQEAVNLISHLEDPQEAAECLAKEALTRMSKNKISCLVIRFE